MSPRDVRRSDGAPHNRLTGIGDAMLDALKAHADARGDELAVVLLASGEERATALLIDDEDEALVLVFEHLAAWLETRGQRLVLLPLSRG